MSSAGIKSDDRVMCILHLRASKTLIPTAPDMNYVAVRLKLCLPMAAGLPIRGSGDFGTSPFFGQLTDKPLLVSTYISGVSDAKRNRGCGTSGLSSDARCNTPGRFGIGRIETSGSVAMRGYSHLSDDEREQIGLLKVLGHSMGAIARAIRRPKSTISRELTRNRLPSGRSRKTEPCGASFSTASQKGGRPSKLRAG